MNLSWPQLVASLLLLQFTSFTLQDEHGLKLNEQVNLENGGEGMLDSTKNFTTQESDQPRHIRRGGTKRRRRLKKRLRTTTILPLDENDANSFIPQQDNPETNQHAFLEQNDKAKFSDVGTTFSPLDEMTIPPPRKRTLKRRRKLPRRKLEDGSSEPQETRDGSSKPPRRRRKGGRRRMRPHIETTEMPKVELYVETTIIPPEAEYTTILYKPTKTHETQKYKIDDTQKQESNAPIYSSDAPVFSSNTPIDLNNGSVYSSNAPTLERTVVSQPSVDLIENENAATANPRLRPYGSKPTGKLYKPLKEFALENIRSEGDRETNEVPSQAPIESTSTNVDYGSKIFDRKALFSKSQKLPETSAIIRKKLTPQQQAERKPSVLGEKQATEASVRYELHKLLPEGYTVPPQVMEPSKLLEKLKEHSNTYRTTTLKSITEEPNYPKFESRKKVKTASISVKTTAAVIVEDGRREKSTFKYEQPLEQTTIIEHNSITEETGEAQLTTERSNIEPLETQDPEPSLNVSNDSIVELLKTDNGHEKLTRILESRNMTVAQLLEHRQRGSSQFHLADIFASRKSIYGKNSTETMSLDQEELGTPLYPEKQTILFPSEEVLGSFPAFVSNQIEAVKKEATPASPDSREPRVFSSMPEFANTRTEDEKLPPWKLPNPKLRPVLVRGNFEEIKISHKPANLDNAEVLRTNRIASTLEADPSTAENSFNRFRHIPVTVKSAIIISAAILILAIFGFLSVLISCRMRQKRDRIRAKQDILCEHLKSEDFMNSQQSLSPVLTKQQGRGAVFKQNNMQSNTTSSRHYYLWQTLRKTLQHD